MNNKLKVTVVLIKHLLFQERMRLSHLQKETERLRQDGPISSLAQTIPPILSGQVNFGYSKSVIK